MIKKFFKTWLTDQSGATAIEYVLIACGVALAIIGTVFAFGDHLYDFMGALTTGFTR